MYELLICWRSTGKTPVIELGEFRKRIGVLDTEYTRTDNLKMRVIELALKQINDHTDITATYEQHKKGRTITGFSFKFKQKKKTESKTSKNSDSSPRIEKPSQIPTNIVKQPENAHLSDLQHRASKITGLIMSNRLSDRFKQSDESVMQMMARIQSEITTDVIADQWENKLEEFGVVFSNDEFPEGHLAIDSNGCFLPCKNLSVTWQSRRKLCFKALLLMDFKKRHY